MLNLNKEELKKEIEQCRVELQCANSEFNEISDPEMIDSCVYKIISLESKHVSLIKKYRSLG